jgi:tetratricopeptide (TPR) repeat protein
MRLAFVLALCDLPSWLTPDFVFRVLESKIFSAISWGGAAIVAIIGFIARMKYRERNLKRLLDAYVAKATKAEGKERESVKSVIRRALRKARGLPTQGTTVATFDTSNVFEDAARLCAQRQPNDAIEQLRREAANCEATVDYANHQVRMAQERAATAYLEIGSILRDQGRGHEALEAFSSMLRVHPGDLDALRMRGLQFRDLERYDEAERDLNSLLFFYANDRAATADVKRDMATVHLGRRNYTEAFKALDEAMEIEVQRDDQRGIALTHESIGSAKAVRTWWQQSEDAYMLSLGIFRNLHDAESAQRVTLALQGMQERRKRNGRDAATPLH